MKVLVDMMNIIFIEFHVARRKLRENGKILDEENLPFYAHLLFNKLNYLFQTYGELEICWEGKKSLEFRKKIFPDYKSNRDKSKGEDEYKTLLSFIPKVKNILNYYPCRQYQIEEAEGDDLMYALSKVFIEDYNEKVLVLSTDGDLVQFLNFWDNIKLYNPIKRKYVEKNKNILLQKAICGDNSDNIPGLFRVGPKTFEKMLEDKTKWNEIINKGNNKQIFESFLKIVDLRNAPKSILEKIKIKIKEEYNEFKPDLIELEYWENKLLNNISRWGTVKEDIWDKIEQKRVIKEVKETLSNNEEYEKYEINKDNDEVNEEEDEIDKILKEYV